MSFAGCVILGSLLLSQNLPPELRQRQQRGYDPVLPAVIRNVITRASEAELDRKRGPGNAVEILKAEKKRFEGHQSIQLALDVRIAATILRSRFLGNEKVDEAGRVQQALSTFSKLDIAEPGLNAWLERAITASPEAEKKLRGSKKKTIKIMLLARGFRVDRTALFTKLQKLMRDVGFEIVSSSAPDADFVMKLVADEARGKGEDPAVRVVLGIERTENERRVWDQELFRTSTAKTSDLALEAGTDWILRIGGRELLFRWLTENGLPHAQVQAPSSSASHDEHDHHSKPPQVSLPRGNAAEPVAPAGPKR